MRRCPRALPRLAYADRLAADLSDLAPRRNRLGGEGTLSVNAAGLHVDYKLLRIAAPAFDVRRRVDGVGEGQGDGLKARHGRRIVAPRHTFMPRLVIELTRRGALSING